jgi:isopentenyldiphosphate isomerase
MFKDSEIAFVYVYTKPVNIDELTLQKEELDGVEWFNLEYVYEECRKHNQKFCAPVGFPFSSTISSNSMLNLYSIIIKKPPAIASSTGKIK